jgi:hypothetical protein
VEWSGGKEDRVTGLVDRHYFLSRIFFHLN